VRRLASIAAFLSAQFLSALVCCVRNSSQALLIGAPACRTDITETKSARGNFSRLDESRVIASVASGHYTVRIDSFPCTLGQTREVVAGAILGRSTRSSLV
jgi:hypothetical protein